VHTVNTIKASKNMKNGNFSTKIMRYDFLHLTCPQSNNVPTGCKLPVNCKKVTGLMWAKSLEKSSKLYQMEVCHRLKIDNNNNLFVYMDGTVHV